MKKLLLYLPLYFSIAFIPKVLVAEDCESILECAQKAFAVAHEARLALNSALPKGSVVAFNLDKCPTNGWKEYKPLRGRVIVGEGRGFNNLSNSWLTQRKLNSEGGEEKHELKRAEMPNHSHLVPSFQPGRSKSKVYALRAAGKGEYGGEASRVTDSRGKNKPHENMQPFHVLKYCERI